MKAERSEAPQQVAAREATRSPRERLELACNVIGSTVIGYSVELAANGGEDLLERVRRTRSHLWALELALEAELELERRETAD